MTGASLERLADEWDDLALRAAAPPFARPGWLRAWWSAFGRGEQRIFALRRHGRLEAVLPLARRRGSLQAWSNIHTPAFAGVATQPGDLEILLATALREAPRGLDLRCLDSGGELSAAARHLEGEGKSRLAVYETSASVCVAPTVDWDQFEQSLSRSRRQNVRRTRRRLADHGEITVETTDGSTDLEVHLAEFLRLEGSGWKVEQGTAIRAAGDTRRFYEEVAAWAASNGLLRLTFMRVGGHAVAVEYMLDDGAHRYGLKLGYDPAFARYGPGLKLQFEEIRHALEDGRIYEMGIGENPIKLELMNAQRTIEHLALFPRSMRGAWACRTAAARQALYRSARGNSLLRRARDTVRLLRARGDAPVACRGGSRSAVADR